MHSIAPSVIPRQYRDRQLLLDHGSNVDAENKDGSTPLHLAVSSWNRAIFRKLLDHGANANAKDKDGWTPLHQASFEGETRTVSLLLDHGASTGVRDREGKTPLQVASTEEVFEMLTKHSAQGDTNSEI